MRPTAFAILLGLSYAAGASGQAIYRSPISVETRTEIGAAPSSPGANLVHQDNLTNFDYRFVDLRWNEGRWQIVARDILVKDFGKQESGAREALRIIRDLHLTQHGSVGSPLPVMEYWLSDGHAPQAYSSAIKTQSFDPATLSVQQLQNQWCLADSHQVLFVFGSHAEEAKRALEVIHQYGFNQIGYIGHPVPIMIYFLGGEDRQMHFGQLAPSRLPNPKFDWAKKAAPKEGSTPPVLPPNTRQLAQPPTRLAGGTTSTEQVPIDWRQIRLQKQGQEWRLLYGDYTLAYFLSEQEARQALATIQYYRFTEQCLVGGGSPSFSYYLIHGHAPLGIEVGTSGIPFRPELLEVQGSGNHFVIAQGEQVLLDFGDKEADAKELLQTIRQQHFDHFCRIGSPATPGLTYFVRTR